MTVRLTAPACGVYVAEYRPSPRASSGNGLPFRVALTETPAGEPHSAPTDANLERVARVSSVPLAGESIHACGEPAHRPAWSTFSRPPVREAALSAATGSTSRSRSAFRPTPLALGNTAFARAAAPETCGVAIEVPSAKR